jgi:hypothetical protein
MSLRGSTRQRAPFLDRAAFGPLRLSNHTERSPGGFHTYGHRYKILRPKHGPAIMHRSVAGGVRTAIPNRTATCSRESSCPHLIAGRSAGCSSSSSQPFTGLEPGVYCSHERQEALLHPRAGDQTCRQGYPPAHGSDGKPRRELRISTLTIPGHKNARPLHCPSTPFMQHCLRSRSY